MNKEFVTYERALALKELGFDDTPWFGNQASLYDVKGEHTMYTNYGVMYSGLSDGYISAPLKQQVFRWFREKYDLLGYIDSDTMEYGIEYSYHINILKRGDTWFNLYIDTYEEAEERCIDKLIEIAKQQDNEDNN